MKIESVTVKGFRCFGSEGTTVTLENGVTALVGGNGSGKTALLQALMRLFGVTQTQRRVQRRDFHIPPDQEGIQNGATLSIEVILSFPELDRDDGISDAVPEFFRQMVASAPGDPLKVRMVLRATWIDDGTASGSIEEDVRYVRTLNDNYDWDNDCQRVPASERSAIQLIYVPAMRNVEQQVTSFLTGRLWQAAKWSKNFQDVIENTAREIQAAFQEEPPAKFVLERLEKRWKQVYEADTDAAPRLRLVERRFEELVRKADFAFYPGEEVRREHSLADLSDGQRSLFQIALTAAMLEVEHEVYTLKDQSPFDQEMTRRAYLTLLAIEEPENSLSPFFLSRIIAQARDIGTLETAQVIISSHSAAILSRIEPEEVRYFRVDRANRQASVRKLTLPSNPIEANKYIRLAVRAYPELYFAKFVILVEGDSERLVIPRIAEAKGVSLDPSFVPIVPLGGRHVTHFWKLLSDLEIPFATLLDLDMGRSHGGAKVLRNIVDNLHVNLADTDMARQGYIALNQIDDLSDRDLWSEDSPWLQAFEEKGIFFSHPLDFDFAMLKAFPNAYKHTVRGGYGPAQELERAKNETLKTGGDATLYGTDYDGEFKWYPYLFLRRSKPETHLAALSRIDDTELSEKAPRSLKSLIEYVEAALGRGGNAE